jgi:hypothetical protein
LGNELASFLVEGTFDVLDLRPLAMTRHVDQERMGVWSRFVYETALALLTRWKSSERGETVDAN